MDSRRSVISEADKMKSWRFFRVCQIIQIGMNRASDNSIDLGIARILEKENFEKNPILIYSHFLYKPLFDFTHLLF